MNDKIKSFMEEWIESNKKIFIDISHEIWSNPELGLVEYKSSSLLINLLEDHGFNVEKNVANMPTAFIATYKGGSGPVIGINAEYDSLPGLSQKAGLAEKIEVDPRGNGHGCGHNILGTAGVMAAIALKNAVDKFNISATIKIFGSPAEELCIGKPFMAREGCYKDVDFFLDWHPWNYNRADYDTCNAYFNIKYHFKGKTAHGNSPWHGKSALDGAMLMGHALEMLREHYPSAPEDAANTLNYTFSNIEPAFPSVVPDKTTLWCIGRFQSTELMSQVIDRVYNCAKAGAIATDTTFSIEFITATHEKIPNKTLSKIVHDNMVKIGLPKFSEKEEELICNQQIAENMKPEGIDKEIKEFGTSGTALCDTAEYSWHAPYATFWLAMAPKGGWHNWMVTSCAGSSIGDKAMQKASEIMSASAVDILLDPSIIKKAKEEFKDRLGTRTYKTLLPEEVKPKLDINLK